jgi:hypothetical protein
MPNPVAVNDLSPISGSLQTSRISYAVETAGKDYGQDYNGTTWYSDIPQNGSQYTIISDNYTANYYVSRSNAEGAYVEGGLPAVDEYSAPVFWLTAGTSSLDIITIVNGLPDRRGQIPFNSGSQALNWIISSSNYFAVGPPYEQIDADNLRVYLDANQSISYPTTQSTWYDLSGYNQNFTLYNGLQTSWNTNGWFAFDQTDDYALNTTVPFQSSSGSIVVTCYPNSGLYDDYIAGVGGDLTIGGSRAIGIISNVWWFVGYGSSTQDYQSGISVNFNRWSQVTYTWNNTTEITASVNGVFETVTRSGLVTPTGVNFTLGRPPWNNAGSTWGGNLAKVQFYPKALTQAEILQNYYGGPIVTNGLIYAIDAGNLVSYPKSGTTVYPLTGSNTDTLTNGVGFSPINDGIWTFDGVDDYIDLSADPWPANAFTNDSVSIWFKFSNYGVILAQNAAPTLNVGSYVPAIYIDTSFYLRTSMFWGGSTGNQSVSPSPLSINTWYNVTLTNGSNTQKTYLNGELIATLSKTQASYAGVYYYTLGAGVWDGWGGITGQVGYLQGQIANLYYYDKELTAAEVLQNYNATK